MKNGSGGHGHRLAAPPVRTWLRRRPIAEVRCRPAGERLTLPWLLIPPCSCGWGWVLDGNEREEARWKHGLQLTRRQPVVAARARATATLWVRILPRHMRRWRRASTFPSRSPSHLGVAMRALRCRWVSRANPHSPLQLDGFAARAVRVCGAVDPAGWCRGPCRLHPEWGQTSVRTGAAPERITQPTRQESFTEIT